MTDAFTVLKIEKISSELSGRQVDIPDQLSKIPSEKRGN